MTTLIIETKPFFGSVIIGIYLLAYIGRVIFGQPDDDEDT